MENYQKDSAEKTLKTDHIPDGTKRVHHVQKISQPLPEACFGVTYISIILNLKHINNNQQKLFQLFNATIDP